MKTTKYIILTAFVLGGMFASCDDFLDMEPRSDLAPETYFTDASQLQAYADNGMQVYFLLVPATPMVFMLMIRVQIIRLLKVLPLISFRVNGKYLIVVEIGALKLSII